MLFFFAFFSICNFYLAFIRVTVHDYQPSQQELCIRVHNIPAVVEIKWRNAYFHILIFVTVHTWYHNPLHFTCLVMVLEYSNSLIQISFISSLATFWPFIFIVVVIIVVKIVKIGRNFVPWDFFLSDYSRKFL